MSKSLKIIIPLVLVIVIGGGVGYYLWQGINPVQIEEPLPQQQVDSDSEQVQEVVKEIDKTIDSDSDGLTDYEEIYIYGTDPNNSNTDGDGYSDGEEIQAGYNPLGGGMYVISQIPAEDLKIYKPAPTANFNFFTLLENNNYSVYEEHIFPFKNLNNESINYRLKDQVFTVIEGVIRILSNKESKYESNEFKKFENLIAPFVSFSEGLGVADGGLASPVERDYGYAFRQLGFIGSNKCGNDVEQESGGFGKGLIFIDGLITRDGTIIFLGASCYKADSTKSSLLIDSDFTYGRLWSEKIIPIKD